MTAVRPAEQALSQTLVDPRPDIHLVEIVITALFHEELANMTFDVTGTLSFLAAEAPNRTEYPFTTQIKAPPFTLIHSVEQKATGTAAMASIMVAVDVPRGTSVEDTMLDLVLVEVKNAAADSLQSLAPLSLLHFFHDPSVSDCAFLTKGSDTLLYATRVVLMRASPYFRSMFTGPWAESALAVTKDPIPFTAWDAPAVVLAFIHIYSGWTPDQPALPAQTSEDLLMDFSCDPATLSFSMWRHLLELAQYLRLKPLALAVNRKLISLLEEQSRELLQKPDEPMDNAPRPSKRRRIDPAHVDSATAATNTDTAPPVPSATPDSDLAVPE
ncbi:hypothetical protein GGF32_001116 [Allomyces javanicus]|nr:hypothetical protein GGF32_001116 [Allomyces javanicus]